MSVLLCSGDGAVFRATLKNVARTQNTSAPATDTRATSNKALAEAGNLTLATLLKVVRALGL